MSLADANRGCRWHVILPANATACETYAAAEFNRYVESQTGVKPSSEGGAAVFIERGEGELGEDGFRLKVRGGALHIAGGRRGVLYGVYEVLERFGGVEWLSPWCTVVPERASFSVPCNLDEVQRPAFEMREVLWRVAFDDADFAARLRINGNSPKLEARHGGKSHRFGGKLGNCHTFGDLLPVEKYGKEHPEYFAMRGGNRLVRAGAQPCLTNPDVLRIVIDEVMATIRRDPEARYYGVSQNDNKNYCECAQCAAIDREEGSHAGTVVRFVNAVAEAVEKVYPDKIVETLAYQYSRKPPAKTRLRKNVMPCLCSIECDFSHPIATGTDRQNVAFRKDIQGWAEKSDQLYVWDYTTNYDHFPGIHPNFDALQENVRFFRECGARSLFEQGAQIGFGAEFEALKAWLLAKWMWNPDLDEKPLLDRFFKGYYGAAAPYVRCYFNHLRAYPRKDGEFRLGCYSDVGSQALIDDAFLIKARRVFMLADKAVRDGDPVFRRNVRDAAFSVDYMIFQRAKRTYLKGQGFNLRRTPEKVIVDAQTFSDVAKSLQERIEENPRIVLAEGEGNARFRKEIRDAASLSVRNDEFVPCDKVSLQEDAFSIVSVGCGCDIVDDATASGGKALALHDVDYQWCASLRLSKGSFDEGARYRLRARIKVSKKPDAPNCSVLNAGAYDAYQGKDVRSWSVRAEEIADDTWQWHDFGCWTPTGSQLLWFSMGVFDHDKSSSNPAAKRTMIDQIEISRVD